jgi:hypothetical protein
LQRINRPTEQEAFEGKVIWAVFQMPEEAPKLRPPLAPTTFSRREVDSETNAAPPPEKTDQCRKRPLPVPLSGEMRVVADAGALLGRPALGTAAVLMGRR